MKLGEEEVMLEVPEGTTVGTLLETLEPRWRGNVIVFSNGKIISMNHVLSASDRILILPLLAGG